jgi:DNA-binding Lrp family transcriptional regulator
MECMKISLLMPAENGKALQNAIDRLTESQVGFGVSPFKLVRVMLDATDRALIALLRENARIGHAEAARRLKLSRTTVQARVESLERRGIIVGYTARLADEIGRRMVRAHVTIVVAPKASAAVVSALQRMPELRALHSVAGVFDLLAVVEAEDVPSLDAAIDKIGALAGVERTQSSIILSTKFER